MLYKTFIDALKTKGRHAEAEHYQKLVAEKFKGQLSQSEIDGLDIDVLVVILKVTEMFQDPAKVSPMQAYVADLQARGFTVSLGEKYRGR
jgi:hypothetical protein